MENYVAMDFLNEQNLKSQILNVTNLISSLKSRIGEL